MAMSGSSTPRPVISAWIILSREHCSRRRGTRIWRHTACARAALASNVSAHSRRPRSWWPGPAAASPLSSAPTSSPTTATALASWASQRMSISTGDASSSRICAENSSAPSAPSCCAAQGPSSASHSSCSCVARWAATSWGISWYSASCGANCSDGATAMLSQCGMPASCPAPRTQPPDTRSTPAWQMRSALAASSARAAPASADAAAD
mmetsp:Transcript_40694/g.103038  ORF Transcript_40694/g.103038 Transcript_40694/m.103038 type:complete len:209 (+) Transcript_40694:372-998(+)